MELVSLKYTRHVVLRRVELSRTKMNPLLSTTERQRQAKIVLSERKSAKENKKLR